MNAKAGQHSNFFKEFAKNRQYIFYYAQSTLKQRVAGNYLGLLWLWLQPFMFMLIYSFVVTKIFISTIPNINVYVLIGLNAWSLISRSIQMSAMSITRNKSLFERVYFHKFVYPTINVVSYIYEFFISTTLVLVIMLFAGIPLTWHFLEMLPVLGVTTLFAYGFALISAHIGVYLFDLANILDFTLRFIFYLSPVMWSTDFIKDDRLRQLSRFNPVAVLFKAFRDCMMYGKSPNYLHLLIIAAASCLVIYVGFKMISRREHEYARII